MRSSMLRSPLHVLVNLSFRALVSNVISRLKTNQHLESALVRVLRRRLASIFRVNIQPTGSLDLRTTRLLRVHDGLVLCI